MSAVHLFKFVFISCVFCTFWRSVTSFSSLNLLIMYPWDGDLAFACTNLNPFLREEVSNIKFVEFFVLQLFKLLHVA